MPKYKTYSELSAAFKAGAPDLNGYFIMLDKGGTENCLSWRYNESLSEAENAAKSEAAGDLFEEPAGSVEAMLEALGIPCEWC